LLSDLVIGSPFMEFRQHHTNGNNEIWNQIKMHFSTPVPKSTPLKEFLDFVYLSQATQALCIKAQTEHYRRNRDTQYNTMGALYWQFNDIWQAPTWSGLEYGGRWKMLHYSMKTAFSMILVSSWEQDGNYNVKIINDHNIVTVVTLLVSVFTYNNSQQQVEWTNNSVVINPLGSKIVISYPVKSILCLKNPCLKPEEIFAVVRIKDSQSNELSKNEYFFSSLSKVSLPKPTYLTDNFRAGGSSITFRLSSSEVAPYLWLESPFSGTFNDNGFLLIGKQNITVQFDSDATLDPAQFQRSLVVQSVADTIS